MIHGHDNRSELLFRRITDYGPDGLPEEVERLSVARGVILDGLPHPEQFAAALAVRGMEVRAPA